jgi:hypothetical protein
MAKRWAVAAVAATAVVVGTGAVTAYRRRRPTRPTPNPTRAPQPVCHEPEEGFEERWRARRQEILANCQRESDVTSFPQALTCALNAAYPECSPWVDPVVWTPWMRRAAELVSDDLMATTGGPEGSPCGWQVRAWLVGPSALTQCTGSSVARALCAAQKLYPWADWGHPRRWQWQLVEHLAHMGAP